MLDGTPAPLGAPPALRPSEYTAALIQALRLAPERVRGAHVLEIGAGSGVVLAALAAMGARSLCGVDIEDEAVEAGTQIPTEGFSADGPHYVVKVSSGVGTIMVHHDAA